MEIVYICPSTPKGYCLWEGQACDIVPHFEERHRDYFLESNSINLNIADDDQHNYLMSLFGQTYLVQTRYSKPSQILELKLRYLGHPTNAAKISYYLEVVSGNFGFPSKTNYGGYSPVTNTKSGSIEVDVQGIKLTCGRAQLDCLMGYVHIENSLLRFGHRSIRRRQFDKRTLETKVRESFRRKSGPVIKVNRNSDLEEAFTKVDVEDDRRSIVEAVNVTLAEAETLSEEITTEKFIDAIVGELIKQTLEEIEKREQEQVTNRQDIVDDDGKFARRYSEERNLYHFAHTNFTSVPQYRQVVISNTEEDDEKENKSVVNADADAAFPLSSSLPGEEVIKDGHPDAITEDSIHCSDIEEADKNSAEHNKLEMIKCQKCSLYMVPPIFVCLNGHSSCITCKFLDCDLCGTQVTDMRNYDLEEMSTRIAHPCRFADKGCTYSYSCHEIRHHEIYCEYFKYTCPLCGVFGMFLEVQNHFKLIHPSVKVFETAEHPFGKDSEYILANKFGLFYCTSAIHNSSIEWKVSFCGVERVCFSCEVVIKGKKQDKVYALQRYGNVCNRCVFLNELKTARVKEKNAVLFIKEY